MTGSSDPWVSCPGCQIVLHWAVIDGEGLKTVLAAGEMSD